MSKKIFIGGLSWDTTDDVLEKTLLEFGDLEELKLIKDRDTGRSKGFAFATFVDSNAASNAISKLDGSELDGRKLKVNEAEDKPRGGGGGGSFGNNRY